jgi:hypothetical protein
MLLQVVADRTAPVPAELDYPTSLPPYTSFLAIAIGAESFRAGTARIDRVLSVANEIDEAVRAGGIQVLGRSEQGELALLPLTPYRGLVTVTVRRRPVPTDETAPDPHLLKAAGAHPDYGRPVARLSEAAAEQDELLATATLVRFGRAWIETDRITQFVGPLKQSLQTFGPSTSAGLWSYYLLALDAALRQGDNGAKWFSEQYCHLAADRGLGALFLAERAEFARLRGDLTLACGLMSEQINSLLLPVTEQDPGRVYSEATARFLLGNLLRRGGRYDLARSVIANAESAFDPSIPSHFVESMHCRYALSVCDSVQAIFRASAPINIPIGQLVFSRSLITLANTQAAWFVGDFDTAGAYAREAADGFRTIGYERYAQRADLVRHLVTEWVRLLRRPDEKPVSGAPPVIHRVRTLVRADAGQTVDLADLRPSLVLSILQFGVQFSRDPDADSRVLLPPVMERLPSGQLKMGGAAESSSRSAADAALRSRMGVGPDGLVPLAPD